MKKKILVSIFLVFFSIIFCGCTSNYTQDVHFIHAVCFDKDTKDNSYQILAVCEKQSSGGKSKQEDNYFVAQQNGKSFEEALEKLTQKYSNTYFASSALYFLPDITKQDTLFQTALFLCQNNILPTKANVVLISNSKPYDFLDTIKNEQDIKKILKAIHNKKTNIVHFLANYKNAKVANNVVHLTLSNDKKTVVLYENQ